MAWVFGEDQEDQKKEQGKGKSGWVFEGTGRSGDSRSLEERIRERELEEERQEKQREEKRQEQETPAVSSNPPPLPVAEEEEKSEPSRELQDLMRDPNAGLSAFGALDPTAWDNTTAQAKEEYARVANIESLGSGYDRETAQRIQQQAKAQRQTNEILAAARKQEEEEATTAISQLPEQQQLELYLDPNYTLTDSDKARAMELIQSYRDQGLDESRSTAEQLQALQKKAKGSALGYIVEKTAAGLGSSLEGMKNFFVDTTQKIPVWIRDAGEFAKTEEQLQQALNAGLDISSAEGSAEMSRIINQGLSQSGFNEDFEDPLEEKMSALDALKSDTLREQAALVDSRYNNPAGGVKIAGEVGGAIGGMLPSIGVNALTGGGGMAVMFASAAGNAAEEAKSEGADDTTAYIYGLLSGATEVATEKISGGIPGLGVGGTDNAVKWMLKRASASPATQQVVMKVVDVLGEGVEEYISEVVGAYLEKLYKEDERGAWQTFVETQPDALASLLLGSLTSGVMNVGEIPGIIGSVNTEQALQSGESVTVRQAQNYENLINDLYEPGTQEWQRAMDRALENASPSTRAGMRQLATDQYNAQATPDQLGGEEWYRMQMQQYRNGLASPLQAAQQDTETVQGTIPLPVAGEELAGMQKGQNTQAGEPVRAGRNTVIQRPYQGTKPQIRANTQYETVSVEDSVLKTAQARIEQAREESGGEKIKSSLKRIYREAVGNLFNGRTVAVNNLEYAGEPYRVTLSKKVIDKVISDKNLSAEKMVVFEVIDDVVKNAEYLGSGEYVPHGGHVKDVTRYDYFETQMEINGTPYTVSFDVEVIPGTNKYRTHRVINNLELHPVSGETRSSTGPHKQNTAPNEQRGQTLSAVRTAYSETDAGPAPTVPERFSPSVSNNNIPQQEEIFNTPIPLPIAGEELAGRTSVQSDMSRQARQRAVEAGTASEELLGYTERMAQRSGRQLEYVFEPDSPVGGSVDGERITINLANPDYAFNTAVHEVGHTMKSGNPQQWASFEQAMLRLADSNPEMEAIARGVADAYLSENSQGLRSMQEEDGSLNEAALAEEISLKLAEEIVKDPARITQAVKQDRGMIRKLLDFVRGLKNQAMIRFGKSENAMLDEAERTLVNLLRGRAGNTTAERYSIRQDVDGKPFVEIDEDILAEIPNKDKIKTVTAELRRRYPDGFNWRGWKIDLSTKGIREFTRSKDSQRLQAGNETAFNDKLRTAANLDEIIEVADNIRNEDPKHPRKDKLQSFNRAEIRIRVGQNDYTAEVVTGIYPDTREIFYDIVKLRPTEIKEASASSMPSRTGTAIGTEASSDISIPTQRKDVNSEALTPEELRRQQSLSITPNTESNLPWREYARQRYADLQSRIGKAQTTAIPLPVAQQNIKTPQGVAPLPIAGEQTAKSRQYQTRAENRFVNEIGETLSVPGGARRNVLKPAAQRLTQEIRETGRVSAETANAVFDEVYQQGRIVLDEVYNQYKDLKAELRREPITLAQVDRDSQTYQEFRRSNFGVLNLVNEGGVPVDVKYQDLAERWPELFPAGITNPADQLQKMAEVARSIVKTEADLDTYYGDDPFWKDAARENFDRSLEKLQNEMGVVTRYDAEQAQKQSMKRTAAPPSVEQMQAVYRTAQQLKKKADKVVQKTLLTDADNQTVEGLLRGKISPEQVTGANSRDILRVYEAKKAVRDVMEPIRQYKAGLREERVGTADKFLENSIRWKDKLSGLQYSTETMERNLRDVAGSDAPGLIDYYIKPVHRNEATATRWKNQMRDRVRSLKLNHAESAYLQMYGELQGVEAARQMGLERSDGEIENLRVQEANYYERHKDKIDKAKVERALKVFRGIYDEAIARMNRVYVENGYAPVEYRQGYFPHFTEQAPDGLLGKIASRLGFSANNDTLPTDIAGLTYTFRPGRKYNPFAKQRTGYQTVYDAVKGFDKYIETAADVIYHTGDIQNLRALESAIRSRYSEEGIKEQIQKIENSEELTDSMKETVLAEYTRSSRGHLSKLAQQLTEYTNMLAGKKSLHDRTVESDTGRAVYQVMSDLENKVAANMVAVNPGSWLTNFIPITQASAEVSVGNLVKAAKETAKSWFKDDGFVNESTFLTNRQGSDPLSQTMQRKVSSVMSRPMEWIDMFTANVVTRGKYYENIKAGMTPEMALDNADSFAASIMADRSKGALPTYFNRKNPVTRIFTMYQVEVNNQLRYLLKDLPQAKKDEAIKSIALALLKYFVGAYLYNDLYEYFIGRRPALDVIGLANETAGDLTGYQLPNLIEAGEDLASGESPDFTTQKKGAGQAIATLGEGVAEELPFIGGLLGGGRVPISSALPDIGSLSSAAAGLMSGEMASNKAASTIGKELSKSFYYLLPPFGGGQLKKAVEGISAVARGGVYGLNNDGEKILRFPIEDQSLGTYLQAGLFGPYALPTGQEYAQSGFKSRSVSWTQEWEEAKEQGITFEQFEEWKELAAEVRADKNEKGNSIAGTKAKNLRLLLNDSRFDFTPTQREFLMQQAGYDYYTLEKVKK